VRSEQEQQLPAELRARRDQLELELAALRSRKAKLSEEKYLEEIEKILLAIAALYEGS
jgi:hypothetical protein